MGKLILLLGGARSGKSSTAEHMALERGAERVIYVATAQAFDDEMRERISVHRRTRPAGWTTLEAPDHVADKISAALNGATDSAATPRVIVLDCITLLASTILLALPDPEQAAQADANAAVLAEVNALHAVQKTSAADWIVVSNEVGMGIVPPYRLGRLYRDALGVANQTLARAADEVYLLVAGLPWRLK